MYRLLPNFVTILNLLAGCAAVVAIQTMQVAAVVGFMIFALMADFLDGALARLLGATSAIGKELDSLADIVTFGFVPGYLVYSMLADSSVSQPQYEALVAFLITAFSAVRLAKFNIDQRQSDFFLGLPTPANALLILGLFVIEHHDFAGFARFLSDPLFLYVLVAISCLFLVVELPLASLKFKHFRWRGNEVRYALIFLSAVLVLFLRQFAMAFVVLLYIFISIVDLVFRRHFQS